MQSPAIPRRRCGRTGLSLPLIGFGAMRMHGPDVEPWARLVRAAADAGLSYFDTSNGYCSESSEVKLGAGLRGVPRENYVLSTKSFPHRFPTADAVRKVLDQSLQRLGVEYLDFYQMWCLTWDNYVEIASRPGGTLEGIERAMGEGLVRHLGFTCHDSVENTIRLLHTGRFESATVYYNLLNRAMAPAIDEAGRLGVGVVVMGPLNGGILGHDSPRLRELMGGAAVASTAEAAFRFVLSHPHVTCAISGMMTPQEVARNRRIAEDFRPFAPQEQAAVDAALAAFEGQSRALCSSCRYCMPCPQGVGISEVLRLANAARIYGLAEGARRDYALFASEWPYDTYQDAAACTACGACRAKCPQGIDIPAQLADAHTLLRRN